MDGEADNGPVHVVGAGPSGLVAAITLARAGVDVIVHERRDNVGARFHDDFQGLENWSGPTDVLDELAGFGIEPAFEHVPVREGIFFDPRGRGYLFRSPRPFFYLVRRGSEAGTLDRALERQAVEAGIDLRFNDTVRRLPAGGIVAEGPHRPDAIAVGLIFTTSMADGVYAVISDDLAPKGYSYLLVHGGRGTLASCMFTDFAGQSTYLSRTIAFFEERSGCASSAPASSAAPATSVRPRRPAEGTCSLSVRWRASRTSSGGPACVTQ